MKNKLAVVLLAVGLIFPTADRVQAQSRAVDATLDVLGSVDLCDVDSTFILTLHVGALETRDSVLLYDVVLRYPSDRVSVKQVLFQNTLSQNLETKDFGSREPGQLRVYGFNVSKPITGSQALFAVLFKYKGACSDSVAVDFASLPELNPDAKIYFRTLKAATVPLKIVDKSTRSLTLKFSNDTIVFSQSVTKAHLTCSALLGSSARLESAAIELTVHGSGIELDAFSTDSLRDTVEVQRNGTSYVVSLRSRDGRPYFNTFSFSCDVLSADSVSPGTEIRAALVAKDTCSCVTRWSNDSTYVRKDRTTTEVEWLYHAVWLKSDGDVWELRSMSEFDSEISVCDILGRVVLNDELRAHQVATIRRTTLLPGVYCIGIKFHNGFVSRKLIIN